jgi:thiol-disulfide isomerase/thioredoxin
MPSVLRRLLGILGLAVALLLSATAGAGNENAAVADTAWVELQPTLAFPQWEEFADLSKRERREWFERRALRLRDQGLAFIERFPEDPRRWSVVLQLTRMRPDFIQSIGPNIDSNYRDVVVDQAAAEAWKSKLAELEQAMQQATDLPADVREALDATEVAKVLQPIFGLASGGQPVDWEMATATVLRFADKHPDGKEGSYAVSRLMYPYEMAHTPAESAAQWRRFAASPNAKVAEAAREKLKALEGISGPIELTFTALDGREVDTRKLRGKVVLIVFWATWCGPCMAEKPNVKRVYSAYHERGLEIIGVSCDVAPEHASKGDARIARTAAQVLEFCRANEMPWPQHYEGKKHANGGNTLAARFAVTGIPANFLLDQSGRVVAMNLRGDRLEAEVKKALGL